MQVLIVEVDVLTLHLLSCTVSDTPCFILCHLLAARQILRVRFANLPRFMASPAVSRSTLNIPLPSPGDWNVVSCELLCLSAIAAMMSPRVEGPESTTLSDAVSHSENEYLNSSAASASWKMGPRVPV